MDKRDSHQECVPIGASLSIKFKDKRKAIVLTGDQYRSIGKSGKIASKESRSRQG